MKSFWKDENARVPFAVIGIFLILISTVVSINLNRLDVKMAKTMSSNIDITASDNAIQYAKSDLARAINYAGMKAMKTMGRTPVIDPDPDSIYYTDKNMNIDEFNKNWAKGMILDTLTKYIEANYMYDAFVYNDIAVNVDPPETWEKIKDEIKIEPIKVKLKREKLEPPILKPKQTYETYWKVSVPLKIHVIDLKKKSELMTEDIRVETIITSRYPLLKEMTNDYSDRLNGFKAVNAEMTAFAIVYTAFNGLRQQIPKSSITNVVDNKHLAQMANLALLVDQGFVFNSIDPMSLIDYGKEVLKSDKLELDGDSFNLDSKDYVIKSSDKTEEAEKIYEDATKIDLNPTVIADFINNKSLGDNSEVLKKYQTISESVYKGTIKTKVTRKSSPITEDEHEGYPEHVTTGNWGLDGEPWKDDVLSNEIKRDPNPSPGVLYGEVWKRKWVRDHTWRKTWYEEIEVEKQIVVPCHIGEKGPCYETKKVKEIVERHEDIHRTDSKTDTVTFKLYAVQDSLYTYTLNYIGITQTTSNNIIDVFIKNDDDLNLEDVLDTYKSKTFTDAHKKDIVSNYGFEAPDGIDEKTYKGSYGTSIKDQAQAAVDEIRDQIDAEIHLDPTINRLTRPNPADLMRDAAKDLIEKIETNEPKYIARDRYITDGRYNDARSKVIHLLREWYVDEIKYQIRKQFEAGSEMIDSEIKKQEDAGDLKQANKDATSFLSKGFSLPLGFTMKASHIDEKTDEEYPKDDINAWNEDVKLSIDMKPNYLKEDMFYDPQQDKWLGYVDEITPKGIKYIADPSAKPSGKQFIPIAVMNFNVFAIPPLTNGGLMVLPPSPTTPWIMTVNFWKIRVKGTFSEFTVMDSDDENHPNPIFGHESQIYNRRLLRDIQDKTGIVGSNARLTFEFHTMTAMAVNPGPKGIGDLLDTKGGAFEKSIGATNEEWTI